MKNVKNFFGTLKSYYDNPRLKGVVQLVFWFIFFIIIAIMFRTQKSSYTEKDIEKNNNINKDSVSVFSYEYEYKYTENTSIINISGTHYDNKEKFNLNGSNFYSIDGIYYDTITKNKVEVNYAINEWSYKNIKHITDTNPYSNFTKFKTGIEMYEYNLNKDIYNKYYGTNYSNDIIITINKSDDLITEASINYGVSNVDIKYFNINGIDSLDINVG